MTVQEITVQLENNRKVFENLLININNEEYFWKPEPNKWCLLEIICHLLDEEQEDFGARVKHALENPQKGLVPINPEGWVIERDYINQDYNQKLQEFLNARSQSILYLKKQIKANWDNTITHPVLGRMSAKLFLTNWLAHDYLHMRQIIRYQYIYLNKTTKIDLQYAGNW